MEQVGVDDFSLRDIVKPETAHVRRILSAVINFAKFREERMSVLDQCTQKSVSVSFRFLFLYFLLSSLISN